MEPVSPIVESLKGREVIYAENQPEYMALPALPVQDGRTQGIVTRWRPTFGERLRLLFGGDLYLWVWTFGQPLQPVALEVKPPAMEQGQ